MQLIPARVLGQCNSLHDRGRAGNFSDVEFTGASFREFFPVKRPDISVESSRTTLWQSPTPAIHRKEISAIPPIAHKCAIGAQTEGIPQAIFRECVDAAKGIACASIVVLREAAGAAGSECCQAKRG